MNPADILLTPGGADIAWTFATTLLHSEPMRAGLWVFLACLTAFGTIVLGWHILAGVVASAYSGKILGEQWHQIWAPMRVVIGFGMLIPLPLAAGTAPISGIAGIFEHIALPVSVNLGNAPVNAFLGKVVKEGKPLTTSAMGGRDLAWSIAESEVCSAVVNATLKNAGLPENPLPAVSGRATSKATVWDYGECGAFSFSKPSDQAAFASERVSATAAMVGEVRSSIAAPFGELMKHGGSLAATDAATVKAMLADKGIPNALSAWLGGKATNWNLAVADAAAKVAVTKGKEERARVVEFAEARGFVAAGLYWSTISQTSALTLGLASESPKRSTPTVKAADRGNYEAASAMLKTWLRWDAPDMSANDLAFAGDENSDILAKLLGPLTRSVGEWSASGQESVDPVADMVSFGHKLLVGAEASIAAGLIAKGASSSILGKIVGAEGSVDWAMQWASYLIIVAMIVGAVHAYVLPMIPFVMVFIMAVSWFFIVLEAYVAVHLWAFAMIRMDGREFFDTHQKPGLVLLFNLMLRPALAMLAFCGALIVLPYVLNVLNVLWGKAFYGAQGGHIVGLVGVFVSLILFTWLQWTATLKLFGLIPTIADRVAAWFGANVGGGYDEAGQTAAMAAGMTAMAARPVQSAGMPLKAGPKPEGGKDDGKGPKLDPSKTNPAPAGRV